MRQDSSRLPAKHFKKIYGETTVIEVLLKRLCQQFAKKDIYVLTSNRAVDNPIQDYFDKYGIQVIRGSAYNLISRTLDALSYAGADYFIRVNGDSPLIDEGLMSYACRLVRHEKPDMISNLFSRTFPYGISIEVISAEFYRAQKNKAAQEDVEHVTKHLYRLTCQGHKFLSLTSLVNRSNVRLTIDTQRDLGEMRDLLRHATCAEQPYEELLKLPATSYFTKRVGS